ncbi:MAG: helicase HerA-like domain-containing protein [Vicinamibacteria bacterium]
MAQGLFLGKEAPPSGDALGARIDLDPTDLLTHGLIVGMTGSGKTGLAIAMIEEVLRQGIPVIAIDPKGDLGNLLLLFDDLQPSSFEPWIDKDAARREGKTPATVAAEVAAIWTKGLADWGLGPADIKDLKAKHDAVIYTPGSSAGVQLNVLQSLEAPSMKFDKAPEDLRDEIAGIVSGLLGLLKIDADPLQSQEYILLANIIENAWKSGKSLALESLIAAVADPPFDKIGALPLESVYPRKQRQGLMMALNNLLASPQFESWRVGQPLDIPSMLFAADGRPRLSIIYTAHLSEEERFFVTALILDKVKTWMRRQSGTTSLRALIYMDEIYGYFPPHPANPPTKRPLLTLLKQARAQGVGIVLATQNPIDLDYKGLGNIGTWMVGRLQTDNDRDRLRDGLVGAGVDAAAIETLLSAARKRVFLLHDVHRSKPTLLASRFAMSYLRGPITRDEISILMADHTSGAKATPAASRDEVSTAPVLPAPFKHLYFAKYGAEQAEAHLLVKYAYRLKDQDEVIGVRLYPLSVPSPAEILDAEHIELEDEGSVTASAPTSVRYGDIPAYVATAGAKGIERAVKDRLADEFMMTVWIDELSRTQSNPGESAEDFEKRLESAGGGALTDKLKEKLRKKELDLRKASEDLEGRGQEKHAAMLKGAFEIGASMLGSLFGGRKGSAISTIRKGASAMGGVTSKNRMEDNAEARVEALKQEVEGLQTEIASVADVDPTRFEQKKVAPAKAATKLLRYDIVWVY